MADDPHLSTLLVDQRAVDTARVTAALRGRIAIDANGGGLVVDHGFHSLRVDQKIVALLLGRIAEELLDRAADDRMALKEIIELSGLPRGSAAPVIRRLLVDRRLVAQDADKRYYIPRPKVLLAVEELGHE